MAPRVIKLRETAEPEQEIEQQVRSASASSPISLMRFPIGSSALESSRSAGRRVKSAASRLRRPATSSECELSDAIQSAKTGLLSPVR
jgi:hypothetical protein